MVDISALTRQLDERIGAFANGALQIYVQVVPEAADWSGKQQKLFTDQAVARFAAMLAVVEQGNVIDDELVNDLRDVGKSTALANASLSQLLVVLRISRDMLIANAIDVLKDDSEDASSTIALFLERLIPAVDSMVDAITVGYWSTHMAVTDDELARSVALLNGAPFGAYEVDIDGLLQYANPAFAKIVDVDDATVLLDRPLGDIMHVIRSSPSKIDALFAEPTISGATQRVQISIESGKSVKNLIVDVIVRREDEETVGYCGVVQEEQQGDFIDAFVDASPSRAQSPVDLAELIPHIVALQKSADALKQASDFLATHANSVTSDNVGAVASAIANQGDRLRQDVDALDETRRSLQWPDEI